MNSGSFSGTLWGAGEAVTGLPSRARPTVCHGLLNEGEGRSPPGDSPHPSLLGGTAPRSHVLRAGRIYPDRPQTMRVQTLFQQETLHAQRTRRLEGVAARTVTRTVLLADADTVRSRQSEAPCAHPPWRPETRPPGTRALPRGPRHWGRGAGEDGTGGGQTCGSEAASGSLHWAAAAQAPVPTPRWGHGRAHTMPAPLSPAVLPSGAALGRACGRGGFPRLF